MRKSLILFVTLLLGTFTTALWAQVKQITGTVIEQEIDQSLIGVNIVIKGTSTGTITDLDGNYKLNASPTDVLIFSYIGMVTKEELVGNRSVINVNLLSDTRRFITYKCSC